MSGEMNEIAKILIIGELINAHYFNRHIQTPKTYKLMDTVLKS